MLNEEVQKARVLLDYLRELNIMTSGYTSGNEELNLAIARVRAEIESIVLTKEVVADLK